MTNSPIFRTEVIGCADLDNRSIELRRTIVRVMKEGGRGHLASALSIVEILRVLYDDVLRYDPEDPRLAERDRFILSKGHGCLALYVLLAEKGFFPVSELWKFCKADGILGGHPEYPKIPGVEASTGALGHGLSIGVGFAISGKREGARHRVFVLVGDGECDEGSIWEAAMCASKYRLDNLIVVVDYNKQQSYGTTYEVQDLEPFAAKWSSFGFEVKEVDGHNVDDLRFVLSDVPIRSKRPSAIICHTMKGSGIDCVENNLAWHHKSKVTKEEIESLILGLEAQ
jgi:transketolase